MYTLHATKRDQYEWMFDIYDGDRRLGRIESTMTIGKRGALHGRTARCYDTAGRLFKVVSSIEDAIEHFTDSR